MNARPKSAHPEPSGAGALLLDVIEMPNTTAFAAFVAQLELGLVDLEQRFSGFVTRDSFVRAIGR